MKCFTCRTKMVNFDDVVTDQVRIDWSRCPKCGSVSEMHLDPKDNYITELIWKRED